MFGSLVIVFPTPHEGGALLLRHRGHEWTFDSGQELAAECKPSIGYIAFFSDIEHEVAPVVSGHRITLTYNLYFDDDGPVSTNDAVSGHLSSRLTWASNVHPFREAFNSLLANPEFLGDGGTLAFGLRHIYPIKNNSLEHVYSVLKGSDAVVYQSVLALGFQPVLYLYYEIEEYDIQGSFIHKVVDLSDADYDSDGDVEDITKVIHEEGGIVVHQEGWTRLCPSSRVRKEMPEETVEWVTPVTTFNRKGSAFPTYGNSPTLKVVYGDVCLVVRIGKAGERLGYPRVQPKDADDRAKAYYYDPKYDLPPAELGRHRITRYGLGT
jgi:hypothetical protein